MLLWRHVCFFIGENKEILSLQCLQVADPAGGGNHPKERYWVSDHGKYSSNLLYLFKINVFFLLLLHLLSLSVSFSPSLAGVVLMGFCVFVLQVFDFILEEKEMETITGLTRGWRYILPTIKASLLCPVPVSNSYSYDHLSIPLKMILVHLRKCVHHLCL